MKRLIVLVQTVGAGHPYQVKEWTIPKGQKIIEGLANPQFGKQGGGYQIYIPNNEVLK